MTRHARLLPFAVALMTAVACGSEPAKPADIAQQEPALPGTPPTINLSEEDQRFIERVTMAHESAMVLGNMAEGQARRDDIKQLGAELAADHAAAQRDIAESIGGGDATNAQMLYGAPQAAQAEGPLEEVKDRLETLSGEAFGREYLQAMAQHYQRQIEEMERHALRTDNPQVREFISESVPTLRRHLARVQQLQQTLR